MADNTFNWGNAMTVGGGFLSAGAAWYSAYTALKTSKYAADILKYQAAYIDAVTEIEVAKKKRELKKIIGSQRVRTAAANIMPDVGTPMELQVESEILNEIDINLIRIAGSMQKIGLQGQAYEKISAGYTQAAQSFGSSAETLLDLTISQMRRNQKTTSAITKTKPTIKTPWGGP